MAEVVVCPVSLDCGVNCNCGADMDVDGVRLLSEDSRLLPGPHQNMFLKKSKFLLTVEESVNFLKCYSYSSSRGKKKNTFRG